MSDAEKLKKLHIRRGQIKALCTRAHNTLDSGAVRDMTAAQLIERKSKVEATWFQFDEVQNEIEILQDSIEMAETHSSDREEYEETYYNIIARFQELIISRDTTNLPTVEARSTAGRAQASVNSLKLPKIDLPSFSGNYEECNSEVPLPEVKGQAADIIQSLEVSAENYNEAWEMLKKRYDKKRIIIQRYIRALFELQSVSKENFTSLRHLVDGVLKHLKTLKSIGRPTDSWDDVIIHLITSKVDHTTNKEWENSIPDGDIPTIRHLTDFLEHRCHTLEAVNRRAQPISNSQPKANQAKVSSLATSGVASCQHCRGNHHIYYCERFLGLSPEERLKVVKENKLCWNCMKVSSHTAKACKSGSCKTCGKRHNTLLHVSRDKEEAKAATSSQSTEATSSSSTLSVAHTSKPETASRVLLSTAMINARDCQGKQQSCRALLDSGSQSNFVTEDLVQRLGLQTRLVDISIVGVNNSCSKIQKTVQVQLSSRHYSFKISIGCLVLSRITERLPNVTIDKTAFKIPQNLPLADPEFYRSTDIDLLLGAEMFWNTLCVGQIKESSEHPLLQKTLFGWVIGGKYPGGSVQQKRIQCNVDKPELEQLVERFWQIEQISSKPMLTNEERECEEHFKKIYYRTSQGRFVVQLPIKTDRLHTLGSSYDTALKRFKALELRLDHCPDTRREYTRFIQEYSQLKHLHPVVTENEGDTPVYYMPPMPCIRTQVPLPNFELYSTRHLERIPVYRLTTS